MLFQNKLIVGSIAAIGMTCTSNAAMVMMYLNSASGVSSSTQSYGAAFEGTMQWSYNSGSTAQITVNLTNTSSVTSYLSAFVVGLQNTSFVLTQTSAPTAFHQFTTNGALKANTTGVQVLLPSSTAAALATTVSLRVIPERGYFPSAAPPRVSQLSTALRSSTALIIGTS